MLNRRDFMTIGGLTFGAFGLPSIVDADVKRKHEKAVIMIFLGGGISHQESFNASPTFAEKARSVNGYVDTKHGFKLGGQFGKLAAVSNLFSPVLSFGHINPSHGSATHYMMTGYNENSEEGQNHPSIGSLVNRAYGPTSPVGLPHYVALNKTHADTASYLGNTYNPFSITEEGKRNLTLAIEKDRFQQRMLMMNMLDKEFLKSRTTQDVDGYKRQGREMLLGDVREIFNGNNEPANVQDRYGKPGSFPYQLMMARRLVENGVKFVTINYGGWDMHTGIKEGYAARAPELDHGLSILLSDLSERGLLETTMVVATAEFSRTLLNKDAGRDHWPRLTSLLLAGGKYGGRAIGEPSVDGMEPKGDGFKPVDLLNTVLTHMEVSGKTQYTDTAGRPRFTVEGEAKIIS